MAQPAFEETVDDTVAVGDLTIDRGRFLATLAGQPIPLTYMEFQALYLIARGGGRVAEYDTLAEALWGASGEDYRRRLAVLISRVRAKLGPGAALLQTVRQVGYRLAAG